VAARRSAWRAARTEGRSRSHTRMRAATGRRYSIDNIDKVMPKYIPYLVAVAASASFLFGVPLGIWFGLDLVEQLVEQSKSESALPLFNSFAFALAWSVFGYLPISVFSKKFPSWFQINSWAVTVGVFLIAMIISLFTQHYSSTSMIMLWELNQRLRGEGPRGELRVR